MDTGIETCPRCNIELKFQRIIISIIIINIRSVLICSHICILTKRAWESTHQTFGIGAQTQENSFTFFPLYNIFIVCFYHSLITTRNSDFFSIYKGKEKKTDRGQHLTVIIQIGRRMQRNSSTLDSSDDGEIITQEGKFQFSKIFVWHYPS